MKERLCLFAYGELVSWKGGPDIFFNIPKKSHSHYSKFISNLDLEMLLREIIMSKLEAFFIFREC